MNRDIKTPPRFHLLMGALIFTCLFPLWAQGTAMANAAAVSGLHQEYTFMHQYVPHRGGRIINNPDTEYDNVGNVVQFITVTAPGMSRPVNWPVDADVNRPFYQGQRIHFYTWPDNATGDVLDHAALYVAGYPDAHPWDAYAPNQVVRPDSSADFCWTWAALFMRWAGWAIWGLIIVWIIVAIIFQVKNARQDDTTGGPVQEQLAGATT